MTENVNSNGTCFNIMANNVTLNCDGFTLNYAQIESGYGVNVTGYNYATVRNCNIMQANPSITNAHAIYSSANHTAITGSNITTNGQDSYGISVNGWEYNRLAHDILVTGNTVLTTGQTASAIYVARVTSSVFDSNNFTTTGSSAVGFDAIGIGYVSNSNITNNVISTTSTSGGNSFASSYGLAFSTSSGNIIKMNNISTSQSYAHGIRFSQTESNNNNVTLNRIITQGGSGAYVAAGGNAFDSNYIKGGSFDSGRIYLTAGSNIIINNILNATNGNGVYLDTASSNTIVNNTIAASASGVRIAQNGGANNNITGNNITKFGSDYGGVYIQAGAGNYVIRNTITIPGPWSTNAYGVYLASSGNQVLDNNITTSTSEQPAIYLSSGGMNTINRNKLITDGTNAYGMRLSSSSSNSLSNNNISTSGTGAYGVYLSSSNSNILSGTNTIKTNSTDFVSSGSSLNNTIINMTFNSTAFPTMASFTYSGDINATSADAVPDGSGMANVSRYLNITNTTAAWMNLSIFYNDSGLGFDESRLSMYRYNGSTWNVISGGGVDTTNNFVYANISQFSVFAPMALLDSTPPVIVLSSPNRGAYLNHSSVIFSFTATDDQSATLNCSIYLGGALNQTDGSMVNGSVTSFTVSDLSESHHTWGINCTDAAGNSNLSEADFTVDMTAPVTSASASDDSAAEYVFGTWSNSSYVNVSLACSDGGVTCFDFAINEDASPVFSTLIPDQAYVVKDDTNYKLYYGGDDFASINLAQSPDGMNWTPYINNPIITDAQYHSDVKYYGAGFAGANMGDDASAVTMKYRMWYQGSNGYSISGWRYAESPDGMAWYNRMNVTQFGTPVFSGATGVNYGIADVVYSPSASNTGTDWTFRMYVSVQYQLSPYNGNELVVLAFSGNGYEWTGYDPTNAGYATPVFGSTLNYSDFDAGHIGWFKVIRNSPRNWEAFYSGGNDTTYQSLNGIGYARSMDGIVWTRRQTLFTSADGVAWRNASVWMPSVVKTGDKYQIWFIGSDNSDISNSDWVQWKLGRADLSRYSVIQSSPNLGSWADGGMIYTAPSGSAYYPSVLYDANGFGSAGDPLYMMWYSDGNGAVFATNSTDGKDWGSREASTGLGNDAHHAQVLYDADCFGAVPCDSSASKYRIWYWDIEVNLYNISGIASAESADGVNWVSDTTITQSESMPLVNTTSSGPNNWNQGTYGPISLLYNSTASNSGSDPFSHSYAMYYDGTDGRAEFIGLAYSSDGLFWTAYSTQPVLNISASGWDNGSVSYGRVYRDSNGYHIWYSGSSVSGVNEGIGYAYSEDGKSWTKDDAGNPVFSINDGNTYRNSRVYTPSVVDDGTGMLKMYFSTYKRGDADKKIGMAYLDNVRPVTISREGITTIKYRSVDLAGNVEAVNNRTVKLDRIAPTTTATAVDEAGVAYAFNTLSNSSYVNVTLTCGDGSGSGCDAIRYCLDDSDSCVPSSAYLDVMHISTERISYIRYRSNDSAGNLEIIKSQAINLDTIAPVVAINSPSTDSILSNRTITINFTATDANMGNTNISIYNSTGDIVNSTIVNTTFSIGFCLTPPSNLVAWWPGDDNTTDIIGSNDGTPSSGVTYASGEVGQAFSFDGSSYVMVPNDPSITITGDLTLDAWIDPSSLSGHQNILAKDNNDGYRWRVEDSSGYQTLILSTNAGLLVFGSTSSVQPNVWQHVATTVNFSSNEVKFYLNGVLTDTQSISASSINSGAQLSIASSGGSTNNVEDFNGLIDEIHIYGRALIASEIQAIYTAGSNGICKTAQSPPSGNYSVQLEVPSDGVYSITAIAYDLAGNSNSSEVSNMTVDTTSPVVAINSPSTDGILNNRTITVNLTVTELNVDYTNVSISQDGLVIDSATNSSNGTLIVPLTVSADGYYNISATAYDRAGHNASASVSDIEVDTVPSQAGFVPPTFDHDTVIVSDYAPVNITINESRLTQFQFNWNGTNYSVYDDGLVLAMNFNNNSAIGESDTTAVDISRYGNNGTLMNGATWTSEGRFGSALLVNPATTGYVNVPSSSSLSGMAAVTVEAWIRSNDGNQLDKGILGWLNDNSDAYNMIIYPANTLYFKINTQNGVQSLQGSVSDSLADGWHHVMIVYNGSQMRIYRDGVQDPSTESHSGTITRGNGASMTIGSYSSGAYFNGAIDGLRIWNRTLSADEIAMTYQSEFQRYNSTQYRFSANMTNLTQGEYLYQGIARDEAGNLGYTDGGAFRQIGTLAEVIDILVTPASFDFGPLNPNTNVTSNQSIDLTNTPNSNVPVNISVSGTDFISGSDSISIGNLTMRANESKPDASYFTPDQRIRIDETLCSALLYSLEESCHDMAVDSTVHLWFNLNVPGGQPAGGYSSTVSIKATRAS